MRIVLHDERYQGFYPYFGKNAPLVITPATTITGALWWKKTERKFAVVQPRYESCSNGYGDYFWRIVRIFKTRKDATNFVREMNTPT